MTLFRRFVRGGAIALAAAASLFGVNTQRADTFISSSRVTGRQATGAPDQAPTPAAQIAGQQAIGMISAPDFRSFRQYVPIWVGRPRSAHGRQHGPRV